MNLRVSFKGLAVLVTALDMLMGSGISFADARVCGEGYIDRYVTDYTLQDDKAIYVHINSAGFPAIASPFPVSAYLQNWNGENMIKVSEGAVAVQWKEKAAVLKMAYMSRFPVRIVGLDSCMVTADNIQVMVCANENGCAIP